MAALALGASRLPEFWACSLIVIVTTLGRTAASGIDACPWEVLSRAGAGALLRSIRQVVLHRWLLHMPVRSGARLCALYRCPHRRL